MRLIRQDELIKINASKQPIGKFDAAESFATQRIELEPGDTFYLFSDGYSDPFGGEKGKNSNRPISKTIVLYSAPFSESAKRKN